MKFYLAGPVVADQEIKRQLDNIEETIDRMTLPVLCPGTVDMEEDKPYVYRPGKNRVPNEWGIDLNTWAQCVFTMDVIALDDADWVVIADYGRNSTAGTAWEAGYAFAKGKKILVVQMPGVEETSLMIRGCAANICTYEDFITGLDADPLDWKILDMIYDHKYEDYFYERGRKPNDGVKIN